MACISIMWYDCETWTLTEILIEKLDIYARTFFRIILGSKQSRHHVTNKSLYQLTDQVSLRETISKCQIKFTGYCICIPTDELANRFVIYESKIRSSLRPGVPMTTYINQISLQILQSGEKALESHRDNKDGGEQI